MGILKQAGVILLIGKFAFAALPPHSADEVLHQNLEKMESAFKKAKTLQKERRRKLFSLEAKDQGLSLKAFLRRIDSKVVLPREKVEKELEKYKVSIGPLGDIQRRRELARKHYFRERLKQRRKVASVLEKKYALPRSSFQTQLKRVSSLSEFQGNHLVFLFDVHQFKLKEFKNLKAYSKSLEILPYVNPLTEGNLKQLKNLAKMILCVKENTQFEGVLSFLEEISSFRSQRILGLRNQLPHFDQLVQMGARQGVSHGALFSCFENQKYSEQLNRAQKVASLLKVTQFPILILNRIPMDGTLPLTVFQKLWEQEQNQTQLNREFPEVVSLNF